MLHLVLSSSWHHDTERNLIAQYRIKGRYYRAAYNNKLAKLVGMLFLGCAFK